MNMIRTDVEMDVCALPVKPKGRRLSGRAKARERERLADLALESVVLQRFGDEEAFVEVDIDQR